MDLTQSHGIQIETQDDGDLIIRIADNGHISYVDVAAELVQELKDKLAALGPVESAEQAAQRAWNELSDSQRQSLDEDWQTGFEAGYSARTAR